MTTPTTTPQEDAIEAIRVEVARYGKPTPYALRIRLEQGITIDAYQQAIREGLARYEGEQTMSEWEMH